DTTHVDEQEQVCRRLLPPAATVAYQHVYKDNSRSAWRRDRRRPGWDALVEAIRGGELDMVAIYHGDRLVRQPRDLEDLIDVGSERGITIVSPTGTYNLADPDHQMMLRWMVARAKNEIDHMSRRMKEGHARRRRQGIVRKGGRGGRPYGFAPAGATHRPDEVKLIRESAERPLAGVGAGQIARDWNARGRGTVTAAAGAQGTWKEMVPRPRRAGRPARGSAGGRAWPGAGRPASGWRSANAPARAPGRGPAAQRAAAGGRTASRTPWPGASSATASRCWGTPRSWQSWRRRP